MIVVHKFGSTWDVPDISPFVIKLETYLRMAHIPYETSVADIRKTPKKKLPVLVDNGEAIADSSLIIEHLKRKFGDRLEDGRFGPEERAIARAFKALCETDLYFVIAYLRWCDDDNFAVYRSVMANYFAEIGIPGPLRPLIVSVVRRQMKGQLFQQGVARHHGAEVLAFGKEQVTALADFLGDKPYFMGDRPCTLDATVYGSLVSLIGVPIEGPLKEFARSRPNLVAYCERMRAAYWAEAQERRAASR